MGSDTHRVFSLKYRPAVFEELVGQPHVRQTLVNTLLRSQIAHGYIFAGPRGVGKTTAARLFAKALNCAEGPGPKICDKCTMCREIAGGNSLDVIEMDGASNRKIEDVRALRENVRFVPATGRFKIYIIDEVHMLTQEAFNALLKTLEEPPDHVVFILATTDPQKIPETIHSRCQELEFHRISPSDLDTLIREVCKKEKIAIDEESVGKLSQWSDGSARDALVALEQSAAFSNGDIREDLVDRLFGWVDRRTLEAVIEAVVREDRKRIFELVRQIEDSGKDIAHFFVQTARLLRTAWLSIVDGQPPEPAILKGTDPDALLRMISALLEADRNLRAVRQPGLFLTVKLMELILIRRALTLTDIVRRLEDLELRVTSASDPASSNPSAPKPAETRRPPVNPAQVWPKLVEAVMADDVRLAAWLKEGRPGNCSADARVFPVHYSRQFALHGHRVASEKNSAVLDAALSRLMGESGWHLQALVESADDESGSGGKGTKGVPTKVQAAVDLFESRGVQRRE